MNEPYRLRYTNQIVGSFLAAFLLILFLLLIYTLRVSRKVEYSLVLSEDQLSDLKSGAEVIILGESAGSVKSISYLDGEVGDDGSAMVEVELQIEKSKIDEIYRDSVVTLEDKLGVGASVLVIRRGASRDEDKLAPGSQIQNFAIEEERVDELSRRVESISQSVERIQRASNRNLNSVGAAANRMERSLDESVDPAFDKSREASASFYETSEEMRAATENLEQRMVALTDKVQELIDQDVKQTLAGVQASSADLSEAAESVNMTSSNVDRDVAQTLKEMRDAIDQVEVLARETRDVIRIVRQEASDLPGTTARVNDTMSDTQEMVGEIRSHWLLRRYSNQSQPSTQVSPSSVRGGSAR